ncbi:MAG TPA: TetR/AcrR family transcriptional regulator [Gaiellaceae bacterium]|nr:TetR/AcrR family transcriptional regulator [Gaiellaceae bacterium]
MPAATQEEKRRQILDAAVRAFARKGYHACRVGEIAEEAGVAYGLIYHYFGSKEELLETIFRDTWTQMLARVREVQEEGGPAGEQVRKVTALLLRTWRRDPDLVRVLVHEVTRSPEQLPRQVEEISHAYEALESIVAHGQQTGEFRDDFDAQLAATIFYGALEEILTGWVMGQLPDTDEDIARAEQVVTGLICDGLAPRA